MESTILNCLLLLTVMNCAVTVAGQDKGKLYVLCVCLGRIEMV